MGDFILPHILGSEVHRKLGHGRWKRDTTIQAEVVFWIPRKVRLVFGKDQDSTDLDCTLMFINADPAFHVTISLCRPDFDPDKMVDDVVDFIKTLKRWSSENPGKRLADNKSLFVSQWRLIGTRSAK